VSQAEKRAHHNALERKRRDHIKDSFTSLRESVPALQGEKAVSFTNIEHFGWVVRFQRICSVQGFYFHSCDMLMLKTSQDVVGLCYSPLVV